MTMSDKKMKIAVLGAGGWGTALSLVASEKNEVLIWTHEVHTANEINNLHSNSVYLDGVELPHSIKATNDSSEINDADYVINCIPTQYIRDAVSKFDLNLRDKILVNGSKGIEKGSLLRISSLFQDISGISPEQFCVITGPSHAEEAARRMPTTVVAASEDAALAQKVQKSLSTPYFRVYTSDDVAGCEIGGSIKNVIAIAAGIIDGLGMGDNTKAALITRGLAEISRLGIVLGAKPLTFSGLSGLGDLFVTCNSKHSRNRNVGEMIGRGKKLNEIISGMQTVAEGVVTTESTYQLSRRHLVEMPITEHIYKILFEDYDPSEALNDLMTRGWKHELW